MKQIFHSTTSLFVTSILVIGTFGCSNSNDAGTNTGTDGSGDDNIGGQTRDVPVEDQGPYVSFPAAGVKLVRPDGFDNAESFHGFQQQSTQSSVMVTLIPGPFSQTTRGFTAKQMKTRGMTLANKQNITIDGIPGMLLSVSQSAYGTRFSKWIVVFGNDKETRMITATFPKSDEAKLSSQLKKVVLSTRLDNTPSPVPGADVGFAIVASAKLKLTRGIGKMLVFTKDGVIPAKSPADPIFIAAPSLSDSPNSNERQFAIDRLHQTAHTKINSVTFNNEITIDGLDGYEIVAVAEDVDSGTPLTVYQVILFDDASYILMQGLVGSNIADEYLPEFKAMARSMTQKSK